MPDKVFLDTNILIYAYSKDEVEKQSIANNALETYGENIVISKQVINELVNVLFKKFKLSSNTIENAILELDTFTSNYHYHPLFADFIVSIKAKIRKEVIRKNYTFGYNKSRIVMQENIC